MSSIEEQWQERITGSFYGSDLAGLEAYLRDLGRTWGRERGGGLFWLRFFVLPVLLCVALILLAFLYTPLKNGPFFRIWVGGGLLLLAPAYWALESYLVHRRWFVILHGRGSVGLRLWEGTIVGKRQPGSAHGHLAIRVDQINRQLRVRSENAADGKVDTHYMENFPDVTALQQAVNAAWGRNAFIYADRDR